METVSDHAHTPSVDPKAQQRGGLRRILVEQVNGWTYTQMLMEMGGCMKGWLDECADENVCPWVGQCTDLQGVLVCSPLSAATGCVVLGKSLPILYPWCLEKLHEWREFFQDTDFLWSKIWEMGGWELQGFSCHLTT